MCARRSSATVGVVTIAAAAKRAKLRILARCRSSSASRKYSGISTGSRSWMKKAAEMSGRASSHSNEEATQSGNWLEFT